MPVRECFNIPLGLLGIVLNPQMVQNNSRYPSVIHSPLKNTPVKLGPEATQLRHLVRVDFAMPGENLDLSSDLPSNGQRSASGRSFVGIQFACCDVYCRVYINRESTAYEGNCPRCSKPVRLRIGPGGTSSRFFTAY
jgi:hypothetical protein